MRNSTVLLVLALGCGMVACGSPSGPTTPPPPPPPPPVLAVFSDTDTKSSLMTSDVRDVDQQIVRFDTSAHTLIWAADGRTFPGFTVNGYTINGGFQVRFGTQDGERRAYFTETVRPYICNIEVINGQLIISPTNVPVPGEG